MKTSDLDYVQKSIYLARCNGLFVLKVTEVKDGTKVEAHVVYRVNPGGSNIRLGRRIGAKALFEFVTRLTRPSRAIAA